MDSFLESEFHFEMIQQRARQFVVIHGDNDPLVPLHNAQFLSEKLSADLIIIKNGQHLNGDAGWLQLPECLTALEKLMN